MGLSIAGIERECDFVFANRFLIFADLDETEAERVVSLQEIGIDLHRFLEMLGGGADVPGVKSLSGTLEFLQGFGGNAELGDGYQIWRWRFGWAIRFWGLVEERERITGIERSGKVDCAWRRRLEAPAIALCRKVGSEKQDQEGTDDHAFHVATLTAGHHRKLSHHRVLAN